ncbi:MAG: hypothetical protein JWP01_4248 [Myxococcales bacterium]|nr:hypothetical protein [Myxococcales bacterium]
MKRTLLATSLALTLVCGASSAYAQPAEPTPPEPPATGDPAPPPPAPEPAPPSPPEVTAPIAAPVPTAPAAVAKEAPKKTPWYEKLSLRGYTQVRYNRLPSFDRNPDLINTQGDRSIGEGNGFLIRRARLVIFGDVHEHVSVYLQPDFASSIGDQGGVAILRDWYSDLFLDKEKKYRFRIGQSKVPYGFENLQSSQNRLAFDRNDALNSAVRDERDIGAFFYWSPPPFRARFKHLVDAGLKGSGDYGIVGVGVYNGQTANRPARTDNLHVIARVSVPFEVGRQIVELGGGGYYGKYTVTLQDTDDITYTVPDGDPELVDTRAFGTFVLYPQPIGFTAEYTFGRGPMQGRTDPSAIDSRWLHGGYAQVMYKLDDVLGMAHVIPFARGTYYDGGKKFFPNAPHYLVKELELGVEMQIMKALEITLAYDITDRTSDRFPHDQESGQVTRVQVQVNY